MPGCLVSAVLRLCAGVSRTGADVRTPKNVYRLAESCMDHIAPVGSNRRNITRILHKSIDFTESIKNLLKILQIICNICNILV